MKIPYVDDFLNAISMYRLTLYFLIVLVAGAFVVSFLGLISYGPIDILAETTITVVVCYFANHVFAKLFHAVTNIESVFISALILVLIIPLKFPENALFVVAASVFAMGVKYFVTIEKRHVFNPAAAAVAGIALLSPEHAARWWVGTPAMLPIVLIGGFLLMRKIRRETLVLTFLLSFLGIAGVAAFLHTYSFSDVLNTWNISMFHTALFFFTFVMLTEPFTSPPNERLQQYFAVIVAVFYATPQIRLITQVTPEIALCIGNIFSYIVSPKYRLVLHLKEKIQETADTILFKFGRIDKFSFIPGQYMEWTLPHPHTDSRGNRRYFSIASAPNSDLEMLIKFYDPSSSYKKALQNMKPGDQIIAASLAGDFVLPENKKTPLVFVAGGVGVAPFKSMIEHSINKQIHVDIVVLFINRTPQDIIFQDLFKKAEAFGVRTVFELTDEKSVPANWNGLIGYLTPEKISQAIPDYKSRTFYISGPQLMVQRIEATLGNLGLPHHQIKTDFFPGYAEK